MDRLGDFDGVIGGNPGVTVCDLISCISGRSAVWPGGAVMEISAERVGGDAEEDRSCFTTGEESRPPSEDAGGVKGDSENRGWKLNWSALKPPPALPGVGLYQSLGPGVFGPGVNVAMGDAERILVCGHGGGEPFHSARLVAGPLLSIMDDAVS